MRNVIAIALAAGLLLFCADSSARDNKDANARKTVKTIDLTGSAQSSKIILPGDSEYIFIFVREGDSVTEEADGSIGITKMTPSKIEASSTPVGKLLPPPPKLPKFNACSCSETEVILAASDQAEIFVPQDGKCYIIYGNEGDNVIHAGTKNDVVYGRGGKDAIYGGACSDTVLSAEQEDFKDFNPGEGDKFIQTHE